MSPLAERALALRDVWADLGDGLRVRLRRPPTAKLAPFARGAEPEAYLRCAVGWEGFSEATFLGAAVGASDPIPFDIDAWVVAALDRLDWIEKVTAAMVGAITAHIEKTQADAKN